MCRLCVTGIQADQRVLSALIATYLPELSALLEHHDIELSLITLNWFLTVFASVLHVRILLRVWDLFFYHGSLVVFQVALGMLRMKGEERTGQGTQRRLLLELTCSNCSETNNIAG